MVTWKIEDLAREILDSTFDVHRNLGPGLLESSYEACLAYELNQKGISLSVQKALPSEYKGVQLECGFRIDLLVEKKIVVELKAVESLHPLHMAQVLTYLKLSKCTLGFVLNFNGQLMKHGIRRVVLNYQKRRIQPRCS